MFNIFHDTAVVNKLIKEIVPNIRVATDTRDLLLNCCTGKLMKLKIIYRLVHRHKSVQHILVWFR